MRLPLSLANGEGKGDYRGTFDLLRATDDAYAVLTLTPRGLALLKDDTSCPSLTLARQRPPRKDASRARSRADAESWEGVDRALFERQVLGEDYWAYGVARNRTVVATLIRYLGEQGLLGAPVEPEALFAPTLRDT